MLSQIDTLIAAYGLYRCFFVKPVPQPAIDNAYASD
jgi:hypothetical protein